MQRSVPPKDQLLKRSAWGIVAFVFIVGCSAFGAVGGKLALPYEGYEADLPQGWYQARGVTDALLLTKDGLPLQFIRIKRVSVGQELSHTKKKFTQGMSPEQAAEIEVDALRSTPEIFDFEVMESTPATVTGRPGFRLLFGWKTKDGLRLKRVHYGFVDGKWVYRLIYQAAARHYFDKDLPTFERVRESFRLL